jgi:uncharacterized membrane protein (UPF0127 family)
MFRYAACILLLATACSSAPHKSAAQASPTPTPILQHSPALISTDHGSVLFNVELAVTSSERSRGLMGRNSLGPKDGMAFLFFKQTQAGFWMKDTSIPLSIAFFDNKGKILKIMDMAACEQTTCPVYRPGVKYFGALEVNKGALQREGVEVGDTIHLAP